MNEIDKSSWPDGPWKTEPDFLIWQDEQTGYWCCIKRSSLGNLCGYVGVNKKHQYYGLNYEYLGHLNVHGGVTFTGKLQTNFKLRGLYWIGFDCAHYTDALPMLVGMNEFMGVVENYKTINYVKSQCRKLARELHTFNG